MSPAGIHNRYDLLVVFGQCHCQWPALQGAVVIAVGTAVSGISEQLPVREQRSQVVDEVRLQGTSTGSAIRLIHVPVECDYTLHATDFPGLFGNFGGLFSVEQAHEKHGSVFGNNLDPAGVETCDFYLEQG